MVHQKTAIVLFDGECNFCNGAIQFIIKRDRKAYFRFAPLKSSVGKTLLAGRSELQNLNSIVLIEDGEYFIESTAVLRISKKLNGPWRSASILLAIPRIFRDPIYRYFAHYRYRWFGKKEACMIPTADMKSRFLSFD